MKWKGVQVTIKPIKKESISINTTLRYEVKVMRDIQHQNIASFIGACCDPPNLCILMQTGSKGSLDDILSDSSYPLDWNFKYSLLKVQNRVTSCYRQDIYCRHPSLH